MDRLYTTKPYVDIRDEQSMDYFLAKYVWPSVNGALVQATSILEWGQELLYLGPGSWCQGTGPPDWGLVSNLKSTSEGKFWNLLPGDTKLSVKWYPAMSLSENQSERYQWTLPLSQVSTYAAQSECRYGFLITDQALVVLRFTKERIGQGLAATRPSRTVLPQTHQRIVSNETDVSSLMDAMSLGSFGAQSYDDHDITGAANVEFLPPEYAVIPMSARGKDTLTVKFSIFCLCLMAAGGCGNVDHGYPPLDSWRRVDRQGFIHNTSNLGAKMLPNDAVLYETQEYGHEDVTSEVQDDRVHVSARYCNKDKVEFKNEDAKTATGNEDNGEELMALLLEQRGDESRIREEVVKAAAGNEQNGQQIVRFPFEQRREEAAASITEMTLITATTCG
ncbi:hypothetical protein MY3296_007479 [Beauveria thailandica]